MTNLYIARSERLAARKLLVETVILKPDDSGLYVLNELGTVIWDGVHNFQAINSIKAMRPGDRVLVYHSQKQKAIVGEATVSGDPYLNTADKRTSWAVQLAFAKKYAVPISLANIKAEPSLQDFLLVRNGRLSVMPVPPLVLDWLDRQLTS